MTLTQRQKLFCQEYIKCGKCGKSLINEECSDLPL